jgi:hypothetical protein
VSKHKLTDHLVACGHIPPGPAREISGPAILHYPDIVAALKEQSVALETIRYVQIQRVPRIVKVTDASHVTMANDIQVAVVLHPGERIQLPAMQKLIWNKDEVQE